LESCREMRGGGYPPELKARAVRMYQEIRPDQATDWEAMGRVAELLGVSTAETVRKWVRQGQVDAGTRAGVSSEEVAEIKRLRRENAELRRANAILRREAVARIGGVAALGLRWRVRESLCAIQLRLRGSRSAAADAAVGGGLAAGGSSGLVRP